MQHQEVSGLRDVGRVDQVVVGVPVFAVSVLQRLHKLHQRLHRDLSTDSVMASTAPSHSDKSSTIRSRMYPEPVDEVVAGQQVIDQELQGVVSSGLVEGEHVKGPLIHLL